MSIDYPEIKQTPEKITLCALGWHMMFNVSNNVDRQLVVSSMEELIQPLRELTDILNSPPSPDVTEIINNAKSCGIIPLHGWMVCVFLINDVSYMSLLDFVPTVVLDMLRAAREHEVFEINCILEETFRVIETNHNKHPCGITH